MAFVVFAWRPVDWCLQLESALAHRRLDIGDFESGFVESHGGVCGREINGDAVDPGDLANSLLDFIDTEHLQHVVHFHDACFHDGSLLSGG